MTAPTRMHDDPILKPGQGKSQALLDVHAQALGQQKVMGLKVNLHVGLLQAITRNLKSL